MQNPSIIYISGIHWIGKTTLCSKIAEKIWMNHVIASSLLKKYKPDFEAIKSMESIKNDVNTVLYWLRQEQNGSRAILFDGHFVLSDKEQALIKIKRDFFLQAQIGQIIMLIDSTVDIKSRLKKRDNKDFSLDFLNQFQDLELEYSQEIASMLAVKHQIFDISKIWQDSIEETLLDYLG